MSKIFAIEPAIDPNARPTFLLDWELTLKCNLDCSYCPSTGPFLTHDNSTDHPPLDECLRNIDFMYAYVDLYMEYKPRWSRAVVLNIYGGESLFHPDIVEILKQVRVKHEKYKDRWPLMVTCTTNGVIGKKRMTEIVDLIDEFTVSYHCESLRKQKQQVLDNLFFLKTQKKKLKCVVLMHGEESRWPELLEVIEYCKKNDMRYLPRQLDGDVNSNYNKNQIIWFQQLWKNKSPVKSQAHQQELVESTKNLESTSLSEVGRACCGGRLMCANNNLKEPVFYIPDNHFEGWACSVNWFFLFVRQYTKEIFVNKDCRMNFNGKMEPIGHLDRYEDLLSTTKENLKSGSMPIITCARERCYCGLCSPKAETKTELIKIMEKHVVGPVFEQPTT